MQMRKIKMKYWRRPVDSKENSAELRKVYNKTLDELVETYISIFEDSEKAAAETGFIDGFHAAKHMIIHFLMQKQMGYGEAYFFKLSEIEEIGESTDGHQK